MSGSPAPTRSPPTPPKLGPSTKTSSLYGKAPTPTSPSSNKLKRSTLDSVESEPWWRSIDHRPLAQSRVEEGWTQISKSLSCPVSGEIFLLTSPFIEQLTEIWELPFEVAPLCRE